MLGRAERLDPNYAHNGQKRVPMPHDVLAKLPAMIAVLLGASLTFGVLFEVIVRPLTWRLGKCWPFVPAPKDPGPRPSFSFARMFAMSLAWGAPMGVVSVLQILMIRKIPVTSDVF
jgi:hypothetical protein